MCLYPKLIRNKKYQATAKNGGNIPPVYDTRTLYVAIGCQNCIECRKQKARAWQVRLLEDLKENKNGKFITLTFSDQSIKKITEYIHDKIKPPHKAPEGYELDNAIATTATRLWLERWRKEHKKSLRHWLVTELGHNGTENIHMHGIIWTNETIEHIRHKWEYGYIWPTKDTKIQTYVNEKTINYIIKYISKKDEQHQHYKSIILTSPGIGNNYTRNEDHKKNKYNGINTIETYKTSTGHKIAMPIYWRNKIYNEEEKEALWLQKLDKQKRYVRGIEVDISKGEEKYYNMLYAARKENELLGYGNDKRKWKKETYEKITRQIAIETRIKRANTNMKANIQIK